MEADKTNDLKVGLFVVIGLCFLLGSILLLGGDRFFLTSSLRYQARFEQVQGLAIGSVVSMNGLPVGNIRKIDFEPGASKLNVEFTVEAQYADRLTKGSQVYVRTQGALGDKYILIDAGPASNPPLPEGSIITSVDEEGLIEALGKRGSEITKIVDVINEVHDLVSTVNDEQRSAVLMKNLVGSSQNMNAFLAEARKLVNDLRGTEDENKLRESLTHLASILKKIDQGEGTLGALINDPSIHEKVMSFLGESPRNRYLKPLIRATIKGQETAQD